jgi:hypothetical protein
MPMDFTRTAGDRVYGNAFIGDASQVDHIKLDVSDLTTNEVDASGRLKPNVPLKQDGTLADGTAGEKIYGLTLEATKLPGRTSNTSPALGADTTDPLIAVCTDCQINRDLAEGNLGRAFTPNELAAMAASGSITVTST